MKNNVQDYYNSLQAEATTWIQILSKKAFSISVFRLLIVAGCIAGSWTLWGNSIAVTAVIVVSIALFLVLVKYHERVYRAKLLHEAKLDIAQDNRNRISLNLDKCPTGSEYVDTRHQYAYDLDIFGKYSIFSLISTTATKGGADLLANWLKNPAEVRTKIAQHQEAVRELSQLNDFRNDFRANGMVAKDDIAQNSNTSFSEIPSFKVSAIKKTLIHVVPPLMLVLILLSIIKLGTGVFVTSIFVLSLIFTGLGAKRVSVLHRKLNDITMRITAYNTLFAQVEKMEFKSQLLKDLQYALTADGCKASVATRKIEKVLNNLDQRYNWLSFMILNGFLLWDYRQINNAHKLMTRYAAHFEAWHNSLSYIDALSSLGTFTFNNPQHTFPEIDTKEETIIAGVDFAHPLIPTERCVANGIKTMSKGNFMVVTGANMAGKSTYLRTVGVNYLLALIGSPVAAVEMKFTPVSLFTGLRTTDSLQDNESYFFAELLRLQNIVERATSGERIFVILDEILKGTNSVDKQKGSLALVRKLVSMHTTGIIATHDLMLGSLADEFPDNVSNYCFEAEIKDDNLTFSYKIQEGIAQNMNAYFLMQRMGIV